MIKHTRIILVAVVLLVTAPSVFALQGLSIASEGTNIVLSWPSLGGKTYLIQYRGSFDTNTVWMDLTNNFPAAMGTNLTRYVIGGVVPPPVALSGGGGGGGSPPSPKAAFSSQKSHPRLSFFDTWRIDDRKPSRWELEQRPAYPWEADEMRTFARAHEHVRQAAITEGGASQMFSSSEAMGFFRVFQIPNWQPEFEGATLDDFTFVTVDYGESLDWVVGTEVLIDGQLTDFAARQTRTLSGTIHEGTDFFFYRINNGTHQFQLLTTILLEDTIDEFLPTPTLTLTSKVFTVTVDNLILFTNWEDSAIGTSTIFQAFSTVPNVDWTIEVYDVVNDFVTSHSGHSADGNISWTWDLRDYTGLERDDWNYDPFFQPYLTISQPGLSAAPATKATPKKALDFPSVAKWLVVYQDREKRPGARVDFIEAMNEIAGGPAFWDVLRDTLRLNYGREFTQADRNDSWTTFKGYLTGTDVRNFYYQGHGSPNNIGGDYDVTNQNGQITGSTTAPGSKAFMTTEWVEKNISKNKYTGYRHFRFVFLDGCETSKGGWPGVFNIPKATNTLAFYQNPNKQPHTRPSTFVGWEKVVGGSREWGLTSGYRGFRGNWMFYWALNNQDLDESFRLARNLSGWISEPLMNSALRIYGYNQLGFLEYNERKDWPGP